MTGISNVEAMSQQWDALVSEYIDTEPTRVAIKSGNAELATAIKYLQRAKSKLPLWHASRCYINSTLFEQSSSEVSATAKFEGEGGSVAIDLTCGLGVDTHALSTLFERVHTVEIDNEKAEIARYNFKRLSAQNITVHNTNSEAFIEELLANRETHPIAQRIDLIYIDPSRVKDGKKVYSLEDSSPNIITLLPKLLELTERVIIKLSPLYDVEECFRVFGNIASVSCSVAVLSTNNECKEVLVRLTRSTQEPTETSEGESIEHIVIKSGEVQRQITPYSSNTREPNGTLDIHKAEYIYVPDVAFYKSRCTAGYAAQLTTPENYTQEGYIFTKSPLERAFLGTTYKLTAQMPYKPKAIKEHLKSAAIKTATLHIRNFPYTPEKIKKDLKLKEGNATHLFFTEIDGTPTVLTAQKL
ncbi:MAG: hypothetical protein R3Y61_00075 [Rikenellaceae bacterium]